MTKLRRRGGGAQKEDGDTVGGNAVDRQMHPKDRNAVGETQQEEDAKEERPNQVRLQVKYLIASSLKC